MANVFTAIGIGLITMLSLGATVSSGALVTVGATEISALGSGIANMAQSFISVGMQLLPLILPLLTVFLIFGFVKGFITRFIFYFSYLVLVYFLCCIFCYCFSY